MAQNCHIKTKCSQQIQITHDKFKKQIQITYSKLQIVHSKFKSPTANTLLGVFSHLRPAVQDASSGHLASSLRAQRTRTMFCFHCGSTVAEGSNYCSSCGGKGEALRLLRTNSSENGFKTKILHFRASLIERGYPESLITASSSERKA